MTEPIVELRNVDVALNGTTILRDTNWQLCSGEHWALLGSNGSGKSTFLRLIRGDLWPIPGKGERIYRLDLVERSTAVSARKRVALVSPELHDRYLQQDWRLTGRQVIYSGFVNGDYPYIKPNADQKRFAEEIVDLLRVHHLLRCNVQQISTGELRKLLIARALATRPAILALDEVCDGLDAPSRAALLEMLDRLARSGMQMIVATHRREEIFPAITHVLELENGRITNRRSAGVPTRSNLFTVTVAKRANARTRIHSLAPAPKSLPQTTLLRIEKASIFLDRKRVLRNATWQVCQGEHWAILGANGAGKSTLLKLAAADLRPAWGGKISYFDFSTRTSLPKIKKRIGYISPELQASYRRPIRGVDVVGSGFHSSIGLHHRLSSGQKQRVEQLIEQFGATNFARRTADQMSYGELAKTLLLRALVNGPELLICDEPFSGFDAAGRREFSAALDTVAQSGASLVVATHHVGDLPERMTHGLLLQNGQIVIRGYLEEVRAHPAIQRLFSAL